MSKLRLTLPATSLIKEYIPDMIVLSIFFVVFDAMRKNTDFEKELGFYGSYHQDKVNQIIHLIFIPAIWWSINVWMCCKLGRALLCFAQFCFIGVVASFLTWIVIDCPQSSPQMFLS